MKDKKKFKIVQITPSLLLGGAEKFSVELSNELAKDDLNKVYLVVLQKVETNNKLIDRINENVELIELNKGVSFSIKTLMKIAILLIKIKPDVVHTHVRGLIYSSISLMMLRIPSIQTIHSLAHKEANKNLRTIYRFLFDNFNIHPVSISEEVLKSVRIEYGDDKTMMVTNGVAIPRITNSFNTVSENIKSIKLNDKTKVIINVANINDIKNQLLLIDIFNEFKEENINAILLLIGGSTGKNIPYMEECKIKAQNNKNIFFIGQIANVGDYFSNADAICLSSRYEGLPLVILEAMSMGIPTIATPAGGIPDVIKNGKNGYIADDFEKESLKNKILSFVNKDLPFSKSDMLETYREKYSISKTAKEYIKKYQKIKKD